MQDYFKIKLIIKDLIINHHRLYIIHITFIILTKKLYLFIL